MTNEELPPELERRAVEIARTTPYRLVHVRDVLRNGLRVLGQEKTLQILTASDIHILALAIEVSPVLASSARDVLANARIPIAGK